jgi:hypothetical protein
MSRFKDRVQDRAFELAEEKYNLDFYDLSREQQDEIYSLASRLVAEEAMDRADYFAGDR